jgi:endonuclease/exonuclease/phosphatase family metal-dependent hydrolase
LSAAGDGRFTDIDRLADGLSVYLAPFLAGLMKDGMTGARPQDLVPHGPPAFARAVWSRLRAAVEVSPRLKESAEELAGDPTDADLLAIFRIRLGRLLRADERLAAWLFEAARKGQAEILGERKPGLRELLGKDDPVLRRLDMVYRLRSGRAPDRIARETGVSVEELFRLNRRFCAAGVAGLISDADSGDWLARLGRDDPVLRRLDMIDLVRAGTPPAAVGRAYDALPEYVERLHARFSQSGIAGILTEEETDRLKALVPATVRVASYNLHGLHDNGDQSRRLRRIGWEFARLDPHAAALQEVLSGAGVEDTGAQIAAWTSSMTGYHYRSFFAHCHLFMEKYPEGVALSLRCLPEAKKTIDLTRLPGGLRPSLARNALAVTTRLFGRKVVFVSVHLDHATDPAVRLAQAEKLVAEVEAHAPAGACLILAGDFNDVEDSPAVRFMLSAGYADAYRALHRDGGNTYPAGASRMRIDYVFVKGHSAVVSSGLLADDPDLSDHIGIFAEIS